MQTINYHLDSADATAEQEVELKILAERELMANIELSIAYDAYDNTSPATVTAYNNAAKALDNAEDAIADWMRINGWPIE